MKGGSWFSALHNWESGWMIPDALPCRPGPRKLSENPVALTFSKHLSCHLPALSANIVFFL